MKCKLISIFIISRDCRIGMEEPLVYTRHADPAVPVDGGRDSSKVSIYICKQI